MFDAPSLRSYVCIFKDRASGLALLKITSEEALLPSITALTAQPEGRHQNCLYMWRLKSTSYNSPSPMLSSGSACSSCHDTLQLRQMTFVCAKNYKASSLIFTNDGIYRQRNGHEDHWFYVVSHSQPGRIFRRNSLDARLKGWRARYYWLQQRTIFATSTNRKLHKISAPFHFETTI